MKRARHTNPQTSQRTQRPRRVYVVSLGCSKNLVDTEYMLGTMDRLGLTLASSPREADCLLVNTCAFTEEARQETIETLQDLVGQFSNGRRPPLVVTGCMATRVGDALRRDVPEIADILPLGTYDRLPEVLARHLHFEPGCPTEGPVRKLATPGHTAYLRIAEGCDHTCAFCAIPLIRGRYRSIPLETVVAEARDLAARGVRELSLIAEDTTFYGLDLYRRFCLPELLRALDDIDGIEWIRLLYVYPNLVTDELIETVAVARHICHYVDMPVQHGDDTVLKAMRRGITRARIEEMARAWRAAMPDIVLRTSVIAGFPGETEAAFDELLSLLEAVRFDCVAVFRYSHEPGTRAFDLPDQVPEAVKAERVARVAALAERHATEANQRLVGRRLRVLIDGPSALYPDHLQGRWYGQTPDIDGVTYIEGSYVPGTFVEADVVSHDAFDLFAVVTDARNTR